MKAVNVLLIAVVVVMFLMAQANAEAIFTENFNVSAVGVLGENPVSEIGNWYALAGSWSHDGNVLVATNNYNDVYVGGNLIYSYVSRDLDAAVENPLLTWKATMQWGDDTSTTLRYTTRLVDDLGNGYQADVVRNGEIMLYRLDAGEVTLLGTKTGYVGRTRTITFSVFQGVVEVATESGDQEFSYSVNDSTYTQFSRVDVGGWVASQQLKVDDVSLSTVPEPATIGLLLIGSIVGLARKTR